MAQENVAGTWFRYFPEHYLWSQLMSSVISVAPMGGSNFNELHQIGRRLQAKAGDGEAWHEAWLWMADKTLALAEPILMGLGFGAGRVGTIETDDPDALGATLRAIAPAAPAPRPASFIPVGDKREVLRLALRELQRAAPTPVDVVVLPAGAPFGAVEVNVEGCTLCLACVSACPTGALSDNPDRPMLRFTEDACVQCGLCKATCPEKVITLTPQLDFRAVTASARVLKEEEPFHCIRCGKPFGIKSMIDRIAAKLEGQHWMYTGSAERLELLKMCEDCRFAAVGFETFDPYAAPPRRPVRTTEDYLREREERERADKGEG